MGETAVNPPTSDDPLRLDRCPECGYSLEGLPPAGVCPECGVKYDQSVVVLHGSGRGTMAHFLNARGHVLLLWVGAFVALLAFTWWPSPGGLPNHLGMVMGVYILIGALLVTGVRLAHSRPALVQVQLNRRGCVQFDRLIEKCAFTPYLRLWSWAGQPLCIGTVIWDSPSPWRTLCVVGVVVLVLAGGMAAVSHRQKRSQPEKSPGAASDAGGVNPAARYEWSPWSEVGAFSIRPAGAGCYRLRIHQRRSRWWRMVVDFVDAEVECTSRRAEALSRQIELWRLNADPIR